MSKILGVVGLALSIVSLICAVLAMALPMWMMQEGTGFKARSGIWNLCIEISGVTDCERLDSANQITSDQLSKYRAVRAMVLLAMLTLLGAIVCAVLKIAVMTEKKILNFVAGGLAIAAGLFLMIGMAIYVDETKDTDGDFSYGAGFAFDIVGWLLSWVSGGLLIAPAVLGEQ